MKKTSNHIAGAPYGKYLGIVLVLVGIPIILLNGTDGSDIPLLVGLFILFVSHGKIEDERSVQIRTTSLYIAFVLGYGAKLLTSNLFDHGLIPFQLDDTNQFLILTLGLGNLIFHGRLHILNH